MERELTKKIYEIIHKCQAWIDDEKPLHPEFLPNSWSDDFMEKILAGIKEVMIEQKLSCQNKTYIPEKYLVKIHELDDKEWNGIKREIFQQELNKFVEKYLRIFSVETLEKEFVQIESTSSIKQGEIQILHFWGERNSPEIHFNHNNSISNTDESDDSLEQTIIARKVWNSNLKEDDFETVVRPNKLFSLEIWHNGYQNLIPIYQPKITIGRSKKEDIPLEDDLEISRHHAILFYREDTKFNLHITGQNPVLINETPFFQNQTSSFNFEEPLQIGTYLLRTKA